MRFSIAEIASSHNRNAWQPQELLRNFVVFPTCCWLGWPGSALELAAKFQLLFWAGGRQRG